MTGELLKVKKVMHPIKARLLQVKRVTTLSSSLRRITLTGDELAGFISASFDDHVKLLLPDTPGGTPHVPEVGPGGLVFEEGKPKPVMRDYTPRRYDPDTNELDVDFVLHHEGPATAWATHAQPGHAIGIAGPRGSFVIPAAFDWHLLIGDETALPAIARRVEELPAETRAIAVIKTADEGGRIELAGQCQLDVHWLNAAAGEALTDATLMDITLPEGEGYVWAAGEYSEIKAVRRYLTEERGIHKSRIRAASYWRQATPNSHEQFD